MPTGKNTPFNVTIIGLLLCLAIFSTNYQGACLTSPFLTKLTCHFHHANLFHWFCNVFCLWIMRPSPMQILLAFPIAVASMLFTDEPTAGFSTVIYAYLGMNIFRWNISLIDWFTFIAANIISMCMPNIAWGVHFAAFFLGWASFYTERQIKRVFVAFGYR